MYVVNYQHTSYCGTLGQTANSHMRSAAWKSMRIHSGQRQLTRQKITRGNKNKLWTKTQTTVVQKLITLVSTPAQLSQGNTADPAAATGATDVILGTNLDLGSSPEDVNFSNSHLLQQTQPSKTPMLQHHTL